MSSRILPAWVGALALVSCAQPLPSVVPLGGSDAPPPLAVAAPETAEQPSNPADNVCTGQPSDLFRGHLIERAQSFQDCYSALLTKDPMAHGTVTALLRIGTEGDVERVWLDEKTLPDRDFKACVVRGLSEPFADAAPTGGCIIAEVPLSFTSLLVVEDEDPT